MNYNKDIEKMSKIENVAVIGASDNPAKYGYKVYNDLKSKGINVFPVNNKNDQIQGDKAYETIEELVGKVDLLDFVVPPKVTLQICKEAVKLGYKNFWFQPGSSDEAVIEFLKDKDVNVIENYCLMIETDKFEI